MEKEGEREREKNGIKEWEGMKGKGTAPGSKETVRETVENEKRRH